MKTALGDCFRANGNYFLAHSKHNWKLVHGVVKNSKDGLPMSHCWIEIELDNSELRTVRCIDKSNGHDVNVPAVVYYCAGEVIDTVKYDRQLYQQMLVRHETWGPWQLECDR